MSIFEYDEEKRMKSEREELKRALFEQEYRERLCREHNQQRT